VVAKQLHEATTEDGFDGWQWDDGPIFVGVGAREDAEWWGQSKESTKISEEVAQLRLQKARAEEMIARLELEKITPSHEELCELAKRTPPPPEWLEGDEEALFDAEEEVP